ncbi:MAG TPA: universal stress protein [Anaeromyxobacteraceae bacterium]|nr:universal stress protein [Anaeromyxobacteraceae bacterium]
MTTWRTIACAVDFSPPSRLALVEASELAKRFEAALTLVHVFEPASAATHDVFVAPPELFEQTVREMERLLEGWKSEAERIAGAPVATRVVVGTAAPEIVQFLRQGGFDLVVLGTHGRRGLAHVVLGSVAERVVREAPCPVLVVRGAGEGGAPAKAA